MSQTNFTTFTAAANENLFGISPRVTTSIGNALAQLHSYPAPDAEVLCSALAQHLHLASDQVLVGSGSAELISLLVRTFCQPFATSSILTVAPTYPLYELEAKALGIQFTVAPLTSNFGFDVEGICSKVNETTRICFIANPNNPTGNYLKKEELEYLLHALPPHVTVVLDEAYTEYVTAPDFVSALPYLPQYPNLVILRTFSKAYGIASLRVGYMLAQKELLSKVKQVKQPFNVNHLAQVAALAALEDHEHLAYTLEQSAIGKAHLQHILTELGVHWWPSEGNFLLMDAGLPAAPLFEQLARNGIHVRATQDTSALRITVGPKQHQDYLHQQLKAILAPEHIWENVSLKHILTTGEAFLNGTEAEKEAALLALTSFTSDNGTAQERIALAFARAFSACLQSDANHSGNLYSSTYGVTDMISAFGVFIKQTPLVTFGHLFSNLTIYEATAQATNIHILDLGIGSGLQWLHLLDRLAERKDADLTIKLTGIDIPAAGEDPGLRLRETGDRLAHHAQALGLNFSYTFLAAPLEAVNLQELVFDADETLVVNSAFTLHHIPDQLVALPDQRDRVLKQIAALNPAVFTLTEPDSEHNKLQFMPRLRESLRHYYTVFDVLDTLLPAELPERRVIEQEFFGREIINVISCEGSERVERHERNEAWQRRLVRTGFSGAAVTATPEQLIGTLQLHANFSVVPNGAGYTLCWNGTPVVAATVWKAL